MAPSEMVAWECSACTFTNEDVQRRGCQLCMTVRPVRYAIVAGAAGAATARTTTVNRREQALLAAAAAVASAAVAEQAPAAARPEEAQPSRSLPLLTAVLVRPPPTVTSERSLMLSGLPRMTAVAAVAATRPVATSFQRGGWFMLNMNSVARDFQVLSTLIWRRISISASVSLSPN